MLLEVTYEGEGKGTCRVGGVRVGALLILDGDEVAELGREGLEFPHLRRRGQTRIPAVRRAIVLLPPPLPLPRHLLLLFLLRRRRRCSHTRWFLPAAAVYSRKRERVVISELAVGLLVKENTHGPNDVAHSPETMSCPAQSTRFACATEASRGSRQMASAATARAQCLLGFRRLTPLPRLPFPTPRAANRRGGVRMASSGQSTPPSSTIEVPGAAGPVLVVAAPSLSEADFRSASGSSLRSAPGC